MTTSDTVLTAFRDDLIAAYPLPPAPVAPFQANDPQFFCQFVASPNECGFFVQAALPGRCTLLPVGRNGARTGVRSHVEPTDTNIAGSGPYTRCDLYLPQSLANGYGGVEGWWAHSILFPADWVDPAPSVQGGAWNWSTVFAFHDSLDTPGAGLPLEIDVYPATQTVAGWPTGIHLRGSASSLPLTGSVTPNFDIVVGPVVRNQWYDFVYHIRWAYDATGLMEFWCNGKKLGNYSGRTLYGTSNGVYAKLCLYGVQPQNSINHDRVKIGPTWKSVAAEQLEGMA
jgi:Polysaccharide lyase